MGPKNPLGEYRIEFTVSDEEYKLSNLFYVQTKKKGKKGGEGEYRRYLRVLCFVSCALVATFGGRCSSDPALISRSLRFVSLLRDLTPETTYPS